MSDISRYNCNHRDAVVLQCKRSFWHNAAYTHTGNENEVPLTVIVDMHDQTGRRIDQAATSPLRTVRSLKGSKTRTITTGSLAFLLEEQMADAAVGEWYRIADRQE